MQNWRPADWKRRKKKIDKRLGIDRFSDDDLVEAGADAMLAAIVSWMRKHNVLVIDSCGVIMASLHCKSEEGQWLFAMTETSSPPAPGRTASSPPARQAGRL